MQEVGFQHDSNTYLRLLRAPTVVMLGSVSPNKMAAGTTGTVKLTGLGFTPDSAVFISGDDVDVKGPQFNSQAEIEIDVSVAGNAASGTRNVLVWEGTVKIPGGTSAFHVTSST